MNWKSTLIEQGLDSRLGRVCLQCVRAVYELTW
jgi:hypothetical protein